MAPTDTQRRPWKPYYCVTHDYRSETVSSKFEMCTPDGEGLPKRITLPFVPSLNDLSEVRAPLLSFIDDLDHISRTLGGNGDKGNVTLLSMARNWLCCIGSRRITSKAYATTSFADSRSLLATATILASDKRDASEDRRSRKREHDREMQRNIRHQQEEYIRSLQEQRDSLLELRITRIMEISKRNKQLEDEKAQLEGKLSMLQREGMVPFIHWTPT
ncbi:hypothetical protein V500_05220 [Pseudogymnoascus sp. VKM F-4518 (FW-2643)]|nr:hypothetical protein V500_05220 [Pseudogymnoascus sp. VKM F-4518 (FW-2643)]